MFNNHRLLKIAGHCCITMGLLLACLTATQAQTSRAKSAASYFARGSGMLWLRRGQIAKAEADFGEYLALKPEMKSALEQRISQLHARLAGKG